MQRLLTAIFAMLVSAISILWLFDRIETLPVGKFSLYEAKCSQGLTIIITATDFIASHSGYYSFYL